MNTHPINNSSIVAIVRLALACAGVFCAIAQIDAQTRPARTGVADPSDIYWDARFGIPGIDQAGVRVLFVQGSDVYAGGDFTVAGGLRVNGVARWDGTAWHALGTGVEGTVTAIAASGTDVFVAGTFFRAGTVPARGVARWDGTAWHTLTDKGAAANVQGTISALALIGENLYVGGAYTIKTAAGTLQHIARWNTATGEWSGLGGGLENRFGTTRVNTLALRGRVLYVGGLFSHVGSQGSDASNVAAWDDSLSVWSALGTAGDNGVNGQVTLLKVFGDTIIVGGTFSSAGSTLASHIGRWNVVSQQWSAYGAGLSEEPAAAVQTSTALLVGAVFTDLAGNDHWLLRRWDGASWSAPVAVNGSIGDIVPIGNEYVMSGAFTSVDGMELHYLAKLTGASWSGFAGPLGAGRFAEVNAIAVDGDDVYVGGTFNTVQGRVMNNIARWNRVTNTWMPLGPDTANGVRGDVYAIRVVGDNVYAGGFFGLAGDVRADNIARFIKSQNRWEPLRVPSAPSREGTNGAVYALASDPAAPQYLHIGGAFTIAGGDTVMGMTRWDDVAQNWSPMPGGLEHGYASITVDAMDFDGSTLYVAGAFEPLHGSIKTVFARYSTNAWYLVADNIDGSIRAITHVGPTSVVIGGEFTVFGNGQNISNLVSWNPVLGNFDWLDGGTDGPVRAVATAGSSIFIGGDFSSVGGRPAASVARRTESIWRSFGSGTDGPVNALAASGGDVFAGGSFLNAGEKSAFHFSRWDNRVLPVEETRALPDAPSLSIAPMPVRDAAVLTFRLPAPTDVTIRIYDGLGRLVSTLLEGARNAGTGALRWNTSTLPRGVYYARMSAGAKAVVSPIVLMGIDR